jgi:soluble lytic murein transglycosylase-like protein
MAYIVRYEINRAKGHFWQGLGNVRTSTAPTQMPPGQPGSDLMDVVNAASQRQGLDASLVRAVIQVESAFQPSARSHKGACGLMQVIPATAARYGVNSTAELMQPSVNVEVGTRLLRDLMARYSGDVSLVLAAYNAGEGAVAKHGMRIPPYPETQDYVRKVLSLYGPVFAQRVYVASQQF